MSEFEASIILLTYNNLEYTRQCLESLYTKTDLDFELIVVDNYSQDDTPEYLDAFAGGHPNVQLILNNENFGFACGNNQGAAIAQGRYIIFLNNDTVVTQGWLGGLVQHLQDPGVGMVGPVTNNSGNETRIRVDYTELDQLEAFAQQYAQAHRGESFEVSMLPFLCVALRREVFEEIGPLDERFGLGMFEDDDYAERLHAKGYRILCAEDVYIHHWGSASFSKIDFERYWLTFQENRLKYEQKWGKKWAPPLQRQELLQDQISAAFGDKTWMAIEIINQRYDISRLETEKAALTDQFPTLYEIYSSSAWKGVQAFWRVRTAVAPPESTREKILKQLFTLVRWAAKGGEKIFSFGSGAFSSWRQRSLSRRYTRQLERLIQQHPQVKGTVVFLPSIEWQVPLFQRPHQLALAFASQGYLTFFCERPSGISMGPGFHRIEENLFISNVPVEILTQLRSPLVFTLIYNPDVLAHFSHAHIVYEYIDELDVFPGDREVNRQIHEQLLRDSSLVLATADKLYNEILPVRPDAVLCPNGVDEVFISTAIENALKPPEELEPFVTGQIPVIGYYGALAKWFDYRLLEKVAQARQNYHFVLIGPDYDGSLEKSQVLQIPNVTWLGVKPYRILPSYLKYFDVAIIPFLLNEITHSTSPLKLFEYMTARKPIVTTAMRECMKYPPVLIAENRVDFAKKLDEALALRNNQEYLSSLSEIAWQNSWTVRAQQIIKSIKNDLSAGENSIQNR